MVRVSYVSPPLCPRWMGLMIPLVRRSLLAWSLTFHLRGLSGDPVGRSGWAGDEKGRFPYSPIVSLYPVVEGMLKHL